MLNLRTARLGYPLLVLALLGACSGVDPLDQRIEHARGTTGDVVIGAAWPWEAHSDVLYWDGMQLALDEVNAGGGVLGRRMRILRADDHEDTDEGRLIAERFGSDPDVVAVIGHLQSYVTLAAAPIYEQAGVVLVSATSTTPELTDQGFRHVFRTIFSDAEVGSQMADFAFQKGYRRVAIYYSRDDYGRELANAFERGAAAHGVQVLDRQSYDPNLSANPRSAEQTVASWDNLTPDAVFIAGRDEQGALLVRELRRRGIRAPILGSDALATPTYLRVAAKAAEGTVIATPFTRGAPGSEAQRFTTAFRNRYGKDPDVGAALGYDAVRVLAHAMRQAGSVVPDDVAAALHHLHGWPAVTGTFTFDDTGSLVDMPVHKVIVRGGAFQELGGS